MSMPQVWYDPTTCEFTLFEGKQIFKVSPEMRDLLIGQGADLTQAAIITRLRARIQELEFENEQLRVALSLPVSYEVPSDYEKLISELGEGDS